MSTTYIDEASMAAHRASMPAASTYGNGTNPNGSSIASLPIPNGNSNPSSASSINPSLAKRVHREVRFGNYILGSTLGEGEFGKVKLGWRKDGMQPSQVAIKLIKRDSIMKDSDSEIKVHREINSLKLLNHPNIVNLVEVMKSGKYIGIVLEYASGGELFDYILHHKYLKENVAKKLFAQLVSGVDYMHSKGLIHRDLKLENLLLDKHKNVIISDFGFVNSYNKDKNDFMKTSCGSPCYAAPELVLTQSPYEGRKVDIWSLGVILYAMLSGYLPFDDDPENEDGADIVRLYNYICKTPLTFPEYVSPLARDLLRKIIVPDPKKRININDIRNHPWLTPHVNLLSIRQPEWDRIHKENRQPPASSQQNANKRFSMLNERTNSSALMPKRGRSNSIGGASGATTSSSLANAIAVPSSTSSSTVTTSLKHNENYEAPTSTTPSPTKQYTRGHVKSASMSAPTNQTVYPSSAARNALKAVVVENNFKRNSISSITSLTSSIGGGGSGSTTEIASNVLPLSRSSTYNGGISTIVESPTKMHLRNPAEAAKNNTSAAAAAALSAAALAVRQQQHSPENANNFISLLPTRAAYTSTRLPHSEKKPRPTSYHPSSMTSTLISNSNGGSSSGLLDYITPINLPIPQFLSSSPTKSPPNLTADSLSSTTSVDGNASPPNGMKGVATTASASAASVHSRRNSQVTPIHVNGVLTSETGLHSADSNKNSVLSYLEDKIDALELTDSHSPIKEHHQFSPQLDPSPEFDTPQVTTFDPKAQSATAPTSKIMTSSTNSTTNASSAKQQRPVSQNIESLIPNDIEALISERENKQQQQQSTEKASTRPNNSSSTSITKERENKDKEKEKENKKRNRFSILSFYSTYNSSSNNISSHIQQPPQQQTTTNSTPKKVLEPSTDANIVQSTGTKEKKRVPSSGSSKSTASKKSTTSSSANSTAGKEASAARKVMDFFKRRSVKLG